MSKSPAKPHFDYVDGIIQQQKMSIEHPLLRDPVFNRVLDSFDKRPIRVFQVGAIESLDTKYRVGSGWSDMLFGKYITENGGDILIVDIDINHLANSFLLAFNLQYPIQLRYGDAIDHIETGFDIYYLDGADEPLGNKQTLEQFKKIENTKSMVIVDDIKTKGVDLIEYLNQKGIEFETHELGDKFKNSMITVDMR